MYHLWASVEVGGVLGGSVDVDIGVDFEIDAGVNVDSIVRELDVDRWT